jgi:hypothetical protein
MIWTPKSMLDILRGKHQAQKNPQLIDIKSIRRTGFILNSVINNGFLGLLSLIHLTNHDDVSNGTTP